MVHYYPSHHTDFNCLDNIVTQLLYILVLDNILVGTCHFMASKAADNVVSYEWIVNPGMKTIPAQNINAMMVAL